MTHLMPNGTGSGIRINVCKGSIYCPGTAKLNNDPGLCQLTELALKGYLVSSEIQTECTN